MTYPLSSDHRALQARVRAFADRFLIPHEVHAELNDGAFPDGAEAAARAEAARLGLCAMNMPKALGGSGLSTLEQVLVSEQIGRVTNGLGWLVTTPARCLAEVATEQQLETWVKPTIRGERHECYAITEEEAGSDVDAIRTTARRDGGHYVIDGEKWHVTSANQADYLVVQAKLADGPNAGTHALFYVECRAPGVRFVRTPAYSHTYAHHHPIVAFEGVRVPEANRIGAEGQGMAFTHDWFRYERLMIAARCCGAAERLIEEATAFAKGRIAFGQPIFDNQSIQFMLADSLTELWAARLMVYRLAEAHDAGEDVKILHGQCSMAKLYGSEMANRVADRAVQIFGGRGYMRENVAERFFRELRVDRIWEGTSEIQRSIIAGQLAKRGQEALIG
ncbi:Acyl-CoA dehydrogenase [Tistlia consotensis]|uniref:Medium-chain specific acyl-CoA dehydrogenase, mitochondrial n=1 Tax=Tistlia consotensis USBA 355 TaxID=560819 RepID=A0A1Y6BJV1_9PROT|nr:acyl-CoA dehydrogenase family protein [Tistlia consotensis]SMF13916.1 Acyl-CoA dehydrogenase [Tistlia consotensis USBA 355]SNR50067.1 Acyl-CoA dehydrogenase [Tistlia consotensis]